MLRQLVHGGVLAAHGLVREVHGVGEAAAVVGPEEQGQVRRDAAGLVGLGGDLADQLLGVGDLLLVSFKLLGDFGFVLLRKVNPRRQRFDFLNRTGHAPLGLQECLLGAGQLALVDHQVAGGLRDARVHEFQGLLNPGRLGFEGGLLVVELIGMRHRG